MVVTASKIAGSKKNDNDMTEIESAKDDFVRMLELLPKKDYLKVAQVAKTKVGKVDQQTLDAIATWHLEVKERWDKVKTCKLVKELKLP